MPRRARVSVKEKAVTRKQAAAAFGRKKAIQRRKQSNRRLLQMVGMGSAAGVLFALVWLASTGRVEVALEDMNRRFWQMTAQRGFAMQQVTLVGRNYTEAARVKAAIDTPQGSPLLTLNLVEMRARLQAIPDIESVSLRRRLPDTLEVTLVERAPAALWQYRGKVKLIDRHGVVLTPRVMKAQTALPLVVGEDAPAHVNEIIALLSLAPSLKPDVTAAVRVGGRRWNIQLSREITVLLPEENPEEAWKRFAEMVEKKFLLSKAIRSVDMRLADRVFIMPVDEPKNKVTLTNFRDI